MSCSETYTCGNTPYTCVLTDLVQKGGLRQGQSPSQRRHKERILLVSYQGT